MKCMIKKVTLNDCYYYQVDYVDDISDVLLYLNIMFIYLFIYLFTSGTRPASPAGGIRFLIFLLLVPAEIPVVDPASPAGGIRFLIFVLLVPAEIPVVDW